LVIIIVLLLVIAAETGFIVFKETGILPRENLSTLNFSPPQSGKDVYDNLRSLNCKMYPVTDTAFIGYETLQYVPSYNAFFDLARGESVILWQYLRIDFVPYNNATAGVEGVVAFLLKENCFWVSFTWQFTRSGNVTQQLVSERELQSFLAPDMNSQLMGYLGNLGSTTSKVGKAIQIQSMAKADAGGGRYNLAVWVQNVGSGVVTLDSLYVNGIQKSTGLNVNLPAGDTTELTVAWDNAWAAPNTVDVKVVTTDGTFIEATQTVPGS
jgi:hypothetical protein